MSDPSEWFDHVYWGPGGVDLSRWKKRYVPGIPYKDSGPTTDGQKGAVRKISTGRKARGSSADSLEKLEREKERNP
jgi:hypothetical protein